MPMYVYVQYQQYQEGASECYYFSKELVKKAVLVYWFKDTRSRMVEVKISSKEWVLWKEVVSLNGCENQYKLKLTSMSYIEAGSEENED